MKKYIDAEGLRATIEKIINSIESCPFIEAEFGAEMRREGKIQAYNKTLALIDSLQQEQPIHQDGRFVFPKFLYARTLDNKTIDVSYVPQSMEAIEYVRNDSVEEQPEVDLDLEKDVKSWFFNEISSKINVEHTMYHYFQECARRYFELGLNARSK